MVQFKDVAHLYIGCKLSHKWSSTEERNFVTLGTDRLRLGTDDWVPILRPLSDMTEEEYEATKDADDNAFHELSTPENCKHECGKEYMKLTWNIGAYITAYLLSRHFDLFGLIESGQAIDAITLNPNPYKQ